MYPLLETLSLPVRDYEAFVPVALWLMGDRIHFANDIPRNGLRQQARYVSAIPR